MADRIVPPAPRPAEAEDGWLGLAAVLAPSAGCDCQMLAVTIADGLGAREPRIAEAARPGKKIAER